MATRVTEALREQFSEIGQDPDNFAAEFDHWKSLGARGEYNSYLFGKDGAYSSPTVNGQPNVLRHVHLVPLANLEQKAKWDRAWHTRGRKVSDKALVYVSDPYHGHLLLFILDEPQAHQIARMQTPEDEELMKAFAVVADRFIQTGEITA